MADVTIGDALSLFTKLNTKMLDRIVKLEKNYDTKAEATKKQPEEVVKKAAPVEVESFGRKAIEDLKKIVGAVQVTTQKETQKAKKGGLLDWLLGALGLLGAGLAALYDNIKDFVTKKLMGLLGKAIDLLKSGIKSLYSGLKKGWSVVKNVFGKIASGLKSGAKWVSDKIKTAWDKIKNSKFTQNIKSFFQKVGERVSKFADKLVVGAKTLGQKVVEKFATIKDALKSLTQRAAETLFGKEGQRTLLGKTVDVTKAASKAVGTAAVKGAKAIGTTAVKEIGRAHV